MMETQIGKVVSHEGIKSPVSGILRYCGMSPYHNQPSITSRVLDFVGEVASAPLRPFAGLHATVAWQIASTRYPLAVRGSYMHELHTNLESTNGGYALQMSQSERACEVPEDEHGTVVWAWQKTWQFQPYFSRFLPPPFHLPCLPSSAFSPFSMSHDNTILLSSTRSEF